MAEMALDCVQNVETWEGRSSSQHPTRRAYDRFEASAVNSPTIRQFSSVISLIQLTLTLQFAKDFKYVGKTSVASLPIAEYRSFYRRREKTDFRSRWNCVC
jgi:hypothetical protein